LGRNYASCHGGRATASLKDEHRGSSGKRRSLEIAIARVRRRRAELFERRWAMALHKPGLPDRRLLMGTGAPNDDRTSATASEPGGCSRAGRIVDADASFRNATRTSPM
jgi:hypothetical protein